MALMKLGKISDERKHKKIIIFIEFTSFYSTEKYPITPNGMLLFQLNHALPYLDLRH
jgi:hypothetical protein